MTWWILPALRASVAMERAPKAEAMGLDILKALLRGLAVLSEAAPTRLPAANRAIPLQSSDRQSMIPWRQSCITSGVRLIGIVPLEHDDDGY